MFGAEPTKQQIGVLRALATERKVTVRAGHGVGKSTLASWAIYWFLTTRPEPKIICTAPTFHQLYDVLWAEAASWRQKCPLMQTMFDWKQRRIEYKGSPANWWAAARTASKGEALTGRHAGHFMLIVDEASGIDDEIFQAAEGMLTSENTYVLLIGNPTKNAGYFYDSHNKDKALWSTHHLPCHASPLVSKKYIGDMEARYGYDSNVFRVRVLGDFPFDEEDTLIPANWIQDAVGREFNVCDEEPLILGVDVGAGGDRSVILHRKGNIVSRILSKNTSDTMELVGWIAKEAKDYKADAICIDSIGIGKGAYDRLVERGFNVYSVDVRRKAYVKGFKRLRDELWWRTREHFENGQISIPNDEDFKVELWSVKYKPESNDEIKVEDKASMRSRMKKSPDKADALVLTYYLDDSSYFGETDEEEESSYMQTLNLSRNSITGY